VSQNATVKVRGDASIRVEPDEAILWITLTALADSPGVALRDVSERANSLAGMLDALAIAKSDRSTTGITVHEEFDHAQGERRSLGARATTRASVRLTDPELIGRLIEQAVDEAGALIDGPSWQIAPGNPARLEAARQAAADARRKARAFAEGVGASLGAPLELSEADTQRPPVFARAAARRVSNADPLPVDPAEQEVTAAVEVTFALDYSPPSAGE
jgi:uncharacterized protein YggE